MCGLAGILRMDGASAGADCAERMANTLRHRGPDDAAAWAHGPVAMGHRRLSVIDLSLAGRQPMETADGRFVMVYNGEIYNYRELRAELETLGCRFRSKSDAEVLLQGFAVWQEQVVEKLNGMFAFAIWDTKAQRLFLARDRYGIKPLYYAMPGGVFLFASEIKAMLCAPEFSARLCREGLVEYFGFQNFFSDRTLFDGARLLPPGTSLSIGKEGTPHVRTYWDFIFEDSGSAKSEAEYLDELDALFQQATKRMLVSDVEIGSYLSGGMDSGSITAIASKHIEELKTFTVGFDLSSASGLELAFDERAKAERISYLCGTEHYEMVLKSGDMERAMQRLVWHLEEPRVGQSYPNFYAAKLAGSFCKVVLSGAGGDELFGGYPWRYYRAVVNEDFDDYVRKYFDYWKRLVPKDQISKILGPAGVPNVDGLLFDVFRSVFTNPPGKVVRSEDYVNQSLYFEAKTFLHGLFVVEDKLSMAHGLESRVPFMDNDLVAFAQKVPVRLKLGNLNEVVALNENEPGRKTAKYFEKTRDGKLLLREAMSRHITDKVARDVKQGFSAPDASWFKGESIEYVRRKLMRPNAEIYEFLDRSLVQALIEDHLEGRSNRRLLIWSLLSFQTWIEVFLLGDVPKPAKAHRGTPYESVT